ncbi:MAG: hypothetical protein ACOZAM_21065 [Pseudomonadota bacterium]
MKLPWLTLLLRFGRPQPLAGHLGADRPRARVVLHKQGIWSISAGERFLRYSTKPRPVAKLGKEFAMWQLLRAQGLANIVQKAMTLGDCGDGKILETTLLRQIEMADQVKMTLPIMRALMGVARPAVPQAVPPTVEAGIRLARMACGGQLPSSFAAESAIRDCFARELRVGVSHQDLHVYNVMQDADGKPILIDLKSCDAGRVVSIDILVFAGKYIQARIFDNLPECVFFAQQRRWDVAGLEPVLALIDLPRRYWAHILLLHLMGIRAVAGKEQEEMSPLSRQLYSRVLSRDWGAKA